MRNDNELYKLIEKIQSEDKNVWLSGINKTFFDKFKESEKNYYKRNTKIFPLDDENSNKENIDLNWNKDKELNSNKDNIDFNWDKDKEREKETQDFFEYHTKKFNEFLEKHFE